MNFQMHQPPQIDDPSLRESTQPVIHNNNPNTNIIYGSGDIHNNNQIINNLFSTGKAGEEVRISH